jgi:hypothetical protein
LDKAVFLPPAVDQAAAFFTKEGEPQGMVPRRVHSQQRAAIQTEAGLAQGQLYKGLGALAVHLSVSSIGQKQNFRALGRFELLYRRAQGGTGLTQVHASTPGGQGGSGP